MIERRLAVLVEGQGEVEAVPILLRRMVGEIQPDITVEVTRPIRVRRNGIVLPGELERYLDIAVRQGGPDARILVLLDANGDCPAELGRELLRRARAARSDRKIQVVLAKREYEAWFLAASESVVQGAPSPPTDPEAVSGAKEWIRQRQPYSPTVDQAGMTARFDMQEARRHAPSFDKMWRAIETLIRS